MPESAEEFAARIVAAEVDGALPYAPGSETGESFPLLADGWRVRPTRSPAGSAAGSADGLIAGADPPRSGETADTCWCGTTGDSGAIVVWTDEHWRLTTLPRHSLPVQLFLEPREHADLADLPTARHARMGELLVVVAAAVEALPSVARAHVTRWGDGAGHLHWWVLGRPARPPMVRGAYLPLWAEHLPEVPWAVRRDNLEFVVGHVVARCGGVPSSLP